MYSWTASRRRWCQLTGVLHGTEAQCKCTGLFNISPRINSWYDDSIYISKRNVPHPHNLPHESIQDYLLDDAFFWARTVLKDLMRKRKTRLRQKTRRHYAGHKTTILNFLLLFSATSLLLYSFPDLLSVTAGCEFSSPLPLPVLSLLSFILKCFFPFPALHPPITCNASFKYRNVEGSYLSATGSWDASALKNVFPFHICQ